VRNWHAGDNWLECGVPSRPGSVTRLLLAWRAGDETALARLTPLVHKELQRIARGCMRGERARDSLQATALVHEAYLRLVNTQHVNWQNRAHFLAMAARLMRRILVDLARARQYQKRGGGACGERCGDDASAMAAGFADLL
jgi:RNA polymerase sigma factor (TIGR02999 family)